MQKACAIAQAFCCVRRKLLLDDGFVGAFAGAGTAGDAGIGVDNVLAFALRNAFQGASVGASTARDASISDNICHEKTPP
jgi:hypothetical protein